MGRVRSVGLSGGLLRAAGAKSPRLRAVPWCSFHPALATRASPADAPHRTAHPVIPSCPVLAETGVPALATPPVDIADLKRKSVSELQGMAQSLNLTSTTGLRKQDLIFRIEQTLLDADTVLHA